MVQSRWDHEVRLFISGMIGLAIALLLVGCGGPKKTAQSHEGRARRSERAAGQTNREDPTTRGQYLVMVGGCGDCHTPMKMGPEGPQPDTSRLLSGHPSDLQVTAAPQLAEPWGWAGTSTLTAFGGPWGVSFAANLTPDPETGIGSWTEEDFVQAMKTGKHHGSDRQILPPMPWQNLAQMRDRDLAAIFRYLKSIPPIQNRVPEAILASPPPAQ